jgi:valyl-tRNA synthetase
MENIKDWCISRQLWWGHRIPAFYCDVCGHMEISKTDIEICPKCGAKMRQDDDVLDTWFSSALWPFAALGWPEDNEYLEKFYPNSVLVTGYDIIFFWVARMIFSGLHHTKKIPFNDVLIHGIVRDSQGRKMSKSLGNGIDPLVIIEKYGADALRAQLTCGISPGNDMKFFEEKTEEMRNFANKLWNAARFADNARLALHNAQRGEYCQGAEGDLFSPMRRAIDSPVSIKIDGVPENAKHFWGEDKWILHLANETVKEVTELIDKYELGIAFNKVYSFIWDELCDWYIEMVKPRIFAGEEVGTLNKVLEISLKLLHPFMPFVTEEIYQNLYDGALCVAEYPVYQAEYIFENEYKKIEEVKEGIRKIRNLRAEMDIPPGRKTKICVEAKDVSVFELPFFAKLSYASEVAFGKPGNDDYISISLPSAVIHLAKGDLIDEAAEAQRVQKEKEHLQREIALFESKLSNADFIAKAPEKVINEHREKLAKYKEMYEKIINL